MKYLTLIFLLFVLINAKENLPHDAQLRVGVKV